MSDERAFARYLIYRVVCARLRARCELTCNARARYTSLLLISIYRVYVYIRYTRRNLHAEIHQFTTGSVSAMSASWVRLFRPVIS